MKNKYFPDENLIIINEPCLSDYSILLRDKTFDRYVFDQIVSKQEYTINFNELPLYPKLKNIYVRQPKYILDLGGNIGLSALYFSKRFPNAKIITIEPDTENFYYLTSNTSNNKNISRVEGAIWSKNEPLFINNRSSIISKSGKRNASIYTVTNKLVLNEKPIKSYTINDLIKMYNIDYVDICKIDIQGAETTLFLENNTWLKKVQILFVEIHDRYQSDSFKIVSNTLNKYDFVFLGSSGRDGDMLKFAHKICEVK